MAVNKFFNVGGLNLDNSNEQDLVHKLSAETIQINGINVNYIPRSVDDTTNILNEDVLSHFDSNYEIEMYINSVEGFSNEDDLMSSFGLQLTEELELVVATKRFQAETSMPKPLEGDLIFFPLTKKIFEIKYVEDESPFKPLGADPTFVIRTEIFNYSYEDINTGDAEIDTAIADLDNITSLNDTEDATDEFETEGDALVDWSEGSPFGSEI